MIAQLNGKIISKNSTEIIIDCGGVGYLASIPVSTSERLPGAGESASIFTILIPKEDSLNLYGFATVDEREVFKLLIAVSGIGAKTAIAILSSISVSEFQDLIISGNYIALSKMPGIGKKTAERLTVELRDKISKVYLSEPGAKPELNMIRFEAVSALTTLGYSRQAADAAIKSAIESMAANTITAENLIRVALKFAVK
jgi:Holliday junction DNA helicase RuvA